MGWLSTIFWASNLLITLSQRKCHQNKHTEQVSKHVKGKNKNWHRLSPSFKCHKGCFEVITWREFSDFRGLKALMVIVWLVNPSHPSGWPLALPPHRNSCGFSVQIRCGILVQIHWYLPMFSLGSIFSEEDCAQMHWFEYWTPKPASHDVWAEMYQRGDLDEDHWDTFSGGLNVHTCAHLQYDTAENLSGHWTSFLSFYGNKWKHFVSCRKVTPRESIVCAAFLCNAETIGGVYRSHRLPYWNLKGSEKFMTVRSLFSLAVVRDVIWCVNFYSAPGQVSDDTLGRLSLFLQHWKVKLM